MSEVDGPKFSVNQVNFNSTQKQVREVPQDPTDEESPKYKDFSNPKAEALGRSMLVKDNDNVNSDLKVLLNNPQIADNSDKMFEKAYQMAINAGIKNPYEQAADFSTGKI